MSQTVKVSEGIVHHYVKKIGNAMHFFSKSDK